MTNTTSKYVVNQNLGNLDEIKLQRILGKNQSVFALTVNFSDVTTVRFYKNMHNISDKIVNNKICNIKKHT